MTNDKKGRHGSTETSTGSHDNTGAPDYDKLVHEAEASALVAAAGALRSSDRDKAKVLYRRDADLGNMYAMFALGGLLEESSPIEAGEWFQKAALQGYAPAMLNLGILYSQGRLPDDGSTSGLAPHWLERSRS
jgi:TPR repeat protein